MSYNDEQRRGSGRADPREYGGGGRRDDNYYDQSQRFDDNQQAEGYGSQGGGRDGGQFGARGQERRSGRDDDDYNRRQEGRDDYRRNQGDGYDNELSRPHERRDDGGYGEGRQSQNYDSGSYGSGGGVGGGSVGRHGESSADFDQDEILRQSQHEGSGNSDLFSTAMSFLGKNKQSAQAEDIDEGRLQQSHQQIYQQNGGNQQHDASSLGAGAAMQVFKMFSGGSGSGGGGSGGSGGSGSSQSRMIAMAMQEASKIFDQQKDQGNVQSGTDKQSVINQAAKFALQMYLKGGQGGGSDGGGGGLMSLASKFLR